MDPHLREIGIALGLLAGLQLAIEIGFRMGRREIRDDEQQQLGTVQGAVLGLLALLLGFSFSGAMSRFIERQDIILREANAIGTAYLRADLLAEPQREELRRAIRAYIDVRIQLFKEEIRPEPVAATREQLAAHQREMWGAAIAGLEARPSATLGVLPPINDVIDLLATRNMAAGRHLPFLVLCLLIACAAIALSTIGYGYGLTNRRHLGTSGVLGLLVATALWVTIDLDYPRRGLVQMNADPFLETREAMRPAGK